MKWWSNIEYIRFDGEDDNQRKCIWIVIHSIKANERKPFLLRIENPKNNIGDFKNAQLYFKVLDDGSKQAAPSFMKGDLEKGKMEVDIKPPENISNAKSSELLIMKNRFLELNKKLTNQDE